MTLSGPEHGVSFVIEKTAAGFAAEEASGDHPPEQRWGCGARIQRHRIEGLAETELGIEAHEIEQLERPHAIAESHLDGGVDVGGAGGPPPPRLGGGIF